MSELKAVELVMPGRIADDQIDAPTCRAVARGIAERLPQALGIEQRCPDRLQQLLDELREREAREVLRGNGH